MAITRQQAIWDFKDYERDHDLDIRDEAIDMAIKTLEQEPILDKIRAEIKGMTPTYHNSDWSITDLVPISKVLDMIDKYKAESEG